MFDSYLNEVFTRKGEGWRKTLKEVSVDFGRGKSKHRPRNDPKLYGGTYPFVQTGDIRNAEHYITSYTQTYNETGLAQQIMACWYNLHNHRGKYSGDRYFDI
ncbi:MAG: hypothetical protein R3E89_03270 [Thiolinea sp.]